MEAEIDVMGLAGIEAVLREARTPSVINQAVAPGLGAIANAVRRHAKQRNFVFTDRFGPRRGTPKYRSLRQSIRARRIPGYYGGRRYKTGRAAVFSGGDGAQQAHLVHEGHGGPWPARPYRFLRRAIAQTKGAQARAFEDSLRRRWPRIAARIAKNNRGLSTAAVFGRTVARRGRSR